MNELSKNTCLAIAKALGCNPNDLQYDWLVQHASSRRYLRASHAGESCIVMLYDHQNDELGGRGQHEDMPFINMQRELLARKLPVPRILADDENERWLLLEDLGDESFEERILSYSENKEAHYRKAIELMANMHDAMTPAPNETRSECLAYSRNFDDALIHAELEHFREWALAPFRALSNEQNQIVDALFQEVRQMLPTFERGFVHRDFQSRNLIFHHKSDQLTLIDFQDGLLGPRVYDLCALLFDSYLVIEADMRERLIKFYAECRKLDPAQIRREFYWVGLQRKLKDAGRFIFIDRVRHNSLFLKHFAPTFRYIDDALAALEKEEFRRLLLDIHPGYPDKMNTPPSHREPDAR